MRFSVLLPTREGGSQLEACLRSVLDQGWSDLEVVVADNANTDETQAVLERFSGDPRLVVVRSEKVLSVAENWTRALEASSGDYVVLIGDDDMLLPSYFERVDTILRRAEDPDCLTCSGYYFLTADATGEECGRYRDPVYPIDPRFADADLGTREQEELTASPFKALDFEFGVPALPRTVVSRKALGRLPGKAFPHPYPDLYLQGALLVTAQRWHFTSEKLVVLGAGPGSFWTRHFRTGRDGSDRYLGVAGMEGELPGDNSLNCVMATLDNLKADFPAELRGVEPNRRLYVGRQVWLWLRQAISRQLGPRELLARLRLLRARDWPGLLTILFTREGAKSLLNALSRRRLSVALDRAGFIPLPGARSLTDFASRLAARPAAADPSQPKQGQPVL